METVYIDTSIVSYLVSHPSRDVVVVGKQAATRDWWQRRRGAFHCVTSDETIAEASRGDATPISLRLEVLRGMAQLPVSEEAEALAGEFLGTGALPTIARSDALHLAVATLVEAEYLLTWNSENSSIRKTALFPILPWQRTPDCFSIR